MLTMEAANAKKIGPLLGETARVWRRQLDQRLRPLGLSQAKWRTIAHLASGRLTQRDLAERLGIEEPTLARLLTGLESGGWVKRECARHDRRCKTVHLQRKASALLQQIEATALELRSELLETIPARDLQICLRVLATIRDKAGVVAAAGNGSRRETKRKQ